MHLLLDSLSDYNTSHITTYVREFCAYTQNIRNHGSC